MVVKDSTDSSGADGSGIIHVVNTHYEDQGRKARQESSLVLRAETRKWVDDDTSSGGKAGAAQAGLILLGDLSEYDSATERQ